MIVFLLWITVTKKLRFIRQPILHTGKKDMARCLYTVILIPGRSHGVAYIRFVTMEAEKEALKAKLTLFGQEITCAPNFPRVRDSNIHASL